MALSVKCSVLICTGSSVKQISTQTLEDNFAGRKFFDH